MARRNPKEAAPEPVAEEPVESTIQGPRKTWAELQEEREQKRLAGLERLKKIKPCGWGRNSESLAATYAQPMFPLSIDGEEWDDLAPDDLEKEVLHRVKNIFEYSEDHRGKKGVVLTALRAVNPLYIKVVGDRRGTEYYLPLRQLRSRKGPGQLQILTVLRREDGMRPIRWDRDGLPVENAVVADDMRDSRGKTWFQALDLRLFQMALGKAAINPYPES